MNEQKNLENISKLLSAILVVLVELRDERAKADNKKGRRIEILLAEAGFSGPEISKIINKNLAAVQKTIQRGRSK